ncbi:hypothetical protein [Myceligenerans pegani]|uniref:CD225/dispanin family protein n=1 Tax=Myceligenerans pegani TaxID=2776917 RepID=A0ABR9N141_9MICO|nr:hypothetical protein [Myceligenerans sp. TRM 65318]MBE1877060.1 hypothetical protein [Myceligenerans sp. TRM 65318]MBE3019331.1 hypothetical protein [Myceligenerans sp. TRM 65318]
MTSPDTETNTTETTAPDAAEKIADAVTEATSTDVAKAEVVEEEDPQTVVFSLVGFFLAYIPLVGVIVNGIAVAKAGKEGFDLFLAKWGLVLAILSTVGALILVGLGFWLGLEAGRSGM